MIIDTANVYNVSMTKDEATQKSNLGRRLLVALLLLVFLVIIGILVWRYSLTYTFNDTAFVINGNRYSKQDVRKLIKYSESLGMPKEDAAKMFFEIIKRDTALAKSGFEIKKTDITTEIHKSYPKDKWSDGGVRWLARDSVNRQAIDTAGSIEANSGYLYLLYFSRYLLKGPDYIPTHYNDLNLIKKDQEYAKKQAESFINDLENGNKNSDEVLSIIKKDLRLTPSGVAGTNYSNRFKGEFLSEIDPSVQQAEPSNQAYYTNTTPIPQSVSDYLKDAKLKKGVNQIQIGKVLADATIANPKDKDYKDAYYFFIYADHASNGATVKNYQKNLRELPSRFVGV